LFSVTVHVPALTGNIGNGSVAVEDFDPRPGRSLPLSVTLLVGSTYPSTGEEIWTLGKMTCNYHRRRRHRRVTCRARAAIAPAVYEVLKAVTWIDDELRLVT